MNIFKVFSDTIRYLYEGATALFSPDHDHYPNIGVQPFTGEPYSEWVPPADQKLK
ncbi:hypothetical protein [Leptolyngbya sp. 7M]|uniref:hypothetical protein n=1 Tax=Leptolyngbya sp. 7M TaxID=2812896 RepID=UPI001B8B58F5|nr:hypothetical protein [Leptolyngbya sp. 7M]QYO63051.1 hypothetical protein JVX88_24170 [Leptolyngbya sp. 7M]